jgi:hypothetical protein
VLVADEARRHEVVDGRRPAAADRLHLVVAALRAGALLDGHFVFDPHSFRLRAIGGIGPALRQPFLCRRRLARHPRHLGALALAAVLGLLELGDFVPELGQLVAHLGDDAAEHAVMIDRGHEHPDV